jgi:hypothetical protein
VNHKYTNIKVEINEPHQHRDMPRQSKLKVQEMQSQKKGSGNGRQTGAKPNVIRRKKTKK